MTIEPADEGSTEFEDRPVQLYSCYSVGQADQIKAMLETSGIRVFMTGDTLATAAPHLAMIDGGINIYVPMSQFDQARELVQAAFPETKGPTELREAAERGEVECPECRGFRVTYGTGLSTITIIVLLLFIIGLAILPLLTKRYIC